MLTWPITSQKKALFDTKRVGQNLDETIDTFQSCLRVLDLMTKIHSQITAAKYYSALKSLDELQHNHLKPLHNLPFANHLLSTLPATRQHIKEAVLKDLKTWLFEAREASRAVGQLALQATEQRSRRWKTRKAKDTDGALRLARLNGAVELAVSERHEYYNVLELPEQSASVAPPDSRIDFKPLYHCILVHATLDAKEELQMSYAEDRRAQASLMLTSTNLSPLTPKSLSELLDEMTGFFIIENNVFKTTNGFRSEQQVDELWDGMVDMLVTTLDEELRKTKEVEVYLEAKLKLVAFSQTMEVRLSEPAVNLPTLTDGLGHRPMALWCTLSINSCPRYFLNSVTSSRTKLELIWNR